jgi:hypothetical protein
MFKEVRFIKLGKSNLINKTITICPKSFKQSTGASEKACLPVNPFLFIRGLSFPRSVQPSLTQNCPMLTIPISCGDVVSGSSN